MTWIKIEFYSDSSAAHEASFPRAAGVAYIDPSRITCVQTYPRNDEFMLVGYPTGGYPYLVSRDDGHLLLKEIQVEL